MKSKLSLLFIAIFSYSCSVNQNKTKHSDLPIIGTWELISATSTQKDSTFSTFNPKVKMIKIINPDHFAFFVHDLTMGKQPNPEFSAGAGRFTLVNDTYTEYLEYFSNRAWENNKFEFKVSVKNDTLTQQGVEKVEKLGVDRIITEKYKRLKD
ncbi:hypothetical protein DOS84_05810 [Flavobacterium aquariorum]|uniref:Lipocalin-like domain-containing protein n=1 Tax=Flavobacterium aquariorum TaxID=2217670 RepID=A0A2W7U9S7_9FLAO|nr:hypothetical protein [Flavobacterium aquariorum]PZX94139.1 hypothetical protein DOS84_05810 [Flavobacterium aquariorum]